MDILKEQILRAKELMGIINEQEDKNTLHHEDVYQCWVKVRKQNTGFNLATMGKNCKTGEKCEKCWDNIVTKMFSKGDDWDPMAKENLKEFGENCKGHDRMIVQMLATVIPEMKICLNK